MRVKPTPHHHTSLPAPSRSPSRRLGVFYFKADLTFPRRTRAWGKQKVPLKRVKVGFGGAKPKNSAGYEPARGTPSKREPPARKALHS